MSSCPTPRSGRPSESSTGRAYTAAGKYGVIGFNMPEEFGGGGSDDFRFNAIIDEEIAKAGVHGPALSLHNDVVGPYFEDLTNDEQKTALAARHRQRRDDHRGRDDRTRRG